MSEEEKTQTEPVKTASSPERDATMIEEAVKNAVKAETEKLRSELDSAKTLSEEQVQKAILKDRQRLADVLAGRNEVDDKTPIHQTFLTNPRALFEETVEAAVARARQEMEAIEEERSLTESKKEEVRRAYVEVLSDRQDVLKSQASKDIFLTFYNRTEEGKSEAERMREALVAYDKSLDELGVDRSKISKAVSIDGSGGMPLSTGQAEVSLEDAFRQAQKEKLDAYEKAMGISI